MATRIDVCNLALSHLGNLAQVVSIDPPDGSIEAEYCHRFYPTARDVFLGLPPNWTFARARKSLSLAATAPPENWAYAYSLPADCVKAVKILNPGDPANNTSQPYEIEDGSLYTDVEDALLIYTKRQTDITRYPAQASAALARLLASYIAGPLIKGQEGTKIGAAQYAIFKDIEYPAAATQNANSETSSDYKDFTPDGLKARQ